MLLSLHGEWFSTGLRPFGGPTSMDFCVLGVGIELLRWVLNGGRALGSKSRLRQDLGQLNCGWKTSYYFLVSKSVFAINVNNKLQQRNDLLHVLFPGDKQDENVSNSKVQSHCLLIVIRIYKSFLSKRIFIWWVVSTNKRNEYDSNSWKTHFEKQLFCLQCFPKRPEVLLTYPGHLLVLAWDACSSGAVPVPLLLDPKHPSSSVSEWLEYQ